MIYSKNKEALFSKIRGRCCTIPHSFFLFLFLFPPAPCKHEALLTYWLISIYIPFICVTFVTHTNTACFYFIPLLCFISSFQRFVWLPIRFRSVPLSLSLSSSTDPPHPTFTAQNRWLPHSLIFLFFRFQKFFCWKNAVWFIYILYVFI